MKMNSTQVFYFTLTAYVDPGALRYFYFLVVLAVYAVIVGSNLLLVVVICVNRSLHEPMYMFLCSLFVNELYGSTGLFPFLLVQILSDLHTVSAPLCFLQVFCLYSYASVQLSTLSVMSYDRYLAICFPLQYHCLMTCRRAAILASAVWSYPLLAIMALVWMTASLRLCGNVINSVFCDNFSVVKLSCSDFTFVNVYGLLIMCVLVLFPVLLILYSYVKILLVCFSGSRQTRQKAVSTCTPHLASLINFSFGCCFEILQSRFELAAPPALRLVLSLYYLSCQPLFNPLLYGLNLTRIRQRCRALLTGGPPAHQDP
ncbi:olfactory receptor 11A1-like [Menidia menidia]